MTLAVPVRDAATLGLPGEISETGYVLPKGLAFDEWERVGELLKRVEKSVRWWIGDWMSYGEREYGETYTQAIETTGRSYQDLADMAYVSSKIQFSERSENLSWSHHKAVAPLESPAERGRWLAKADKEDWSTRDLREQLRLTRERGDSTTPSRIPRCNRCGHECRFCEIEIIGSKKKKKGSKR